MGSRMSDIANEVTSAPALASQVPAPPSNAPPYATALLCKTVYLDSGMLGLGSSLLVGCRCID